jgi:hypothetical protein
MSGKGRPPGAPSPTTSRRRLPPPRDGLSESELVELYQLFDQAWALRHTGYAVDACEAIVEWRRRLPVRRLEQRQAEIACARRVRRLTDPDRIASA